MFQEMRIVWWKCSD